MQFKLTYKTFMFAGGIFATKVAFLPDTNLLKWILVCIVFDFVTGVAKAVVQKVQRTSIAYRKTIIKTIQYVGAVSIFVIVGNISSRNKIVELNQIMSIASDGVASLILFIEIVSILENLTSIDNKSMIARYFFIPMYRLVTIQIKNNPFSRLDEKDPKDSNSGTGDKN